MKRPNTQRGLHTALTQFCRYMGAEYPSQKAQDALQRAELGEAIGWIGSIQNLADNTVLTRLNLMRSVYAALTAAGFARKNIFAAAAKLVSQRQRVQVNPTQHIDWAEVIGIIEAPDVTTKEGLRDCAMLACLFAGALRRSEVLGLLVGDVHVTETGVLFLQIRESKGGKSRNQPIDGIVAEKISALVAQRHQEGAREDDPLFVRYVLGTPQHKMSESTLYRHVLKFSGVAPHAARAAAATRCLEVTQGNHDAAARLLGHATIRAVRMYDQRRLELELHPGLNLFSHRS